jgi:serine/threonine protein kinase
MSPNYRLPFLSFMRRRSFIGEFYFGIDRHFRDPFTCVYAHLDSHSFYPCISLTQTTLTRISHSDLKPDNILLDEKGHAHLTDFNIAVHYSDRRLLTGVAGSMAYMGTSFILPHFRNLQSHVFRSARGSGEERLQLYNRLVVTGCLCL